MSAGMSPSFHRNSQTEDLAQAMQRWFAFLSGSICGWPTCRCLEGPRWPAQREFQAHDIGGVSELGGERLVTFREVLRQADRRAVRPLTLQS